MTAAAACYEHTATVYRDALPTMLDRWRRLDEAVRAGVARVERRGWRGLPDEARRAIDALRQRGALPPVTVHDALSAIDALERCRDALDAALATLDDPSAPCHLPATEWPAVGFPWMRALDAALADLSSAALDAEAQRALAARTLAVARGLDAGAALEPVHLPGARARVRVDGAPMVLDVWSVRGAGFWAGARVEAGLLTTARRSAPRLVLRPEAAAVHGRSGRSAATGDPEFDGRFVWEGEPGATAPLQRPELRRALRVVAMDDVPTLTVADGLAALRWSFAPSARSVGAAVTALRGAR